LLARCAFEGGDFLCSSIVGDAIWFYHIHPATKRQHGIASVTLVSRKRNHGICRVFATRRHHQRCCACETLQVPRYALCGSHTSRDESPARGQCKTPHCTLVCAADSEEYLKTSVHMSPVLAPSDYHVLSFVQGQRLGRHCLSFCRREIFGPPERWQK
jgi:hypothetical protein